MGYHSNKHKRKEEAIFFLVDNSNGFIFTRPAYSFSVKKINQNLYANG